MQILVQFSLSMHIGDLETFLIVSTLVNRADPGVFGVLKPSPQPYQGIKETDVLVQNTKM